ncbi:MAG: DUF3037 domain-containing protein [Bryobacteraceae bacterium]
MQSSFDYATIRVVPRVDREEFINAGVILFCKERRFLQARVTLDPERVRALWPESDIDLVQLHLMAFSKICEGDPAAGPIARLSQAERFHWLVSPRSTAVQVSPVHTGLCQDPQIAFERLFQQLVAIESTGDMG